MVFAAVLFAATHIKMFTIDDAASHNNLGDTYKNIGRYDDALKEFNEAIRLDPNLQEGALQSGRCL